jgi:hypothetical protein
MTSRAELLAELEEKRLKNKEIERKLDKFSISGPSEQAGYDPYDNPSLGKELPDDADITARRRRILARYRRR